MRRTIIFKLFNLIILTLPLASCGELFDFGTEEDPIDLKMELNRHEMTLMVGDKCIVSAAFKPDDGKEHSVFWLSDDIDVAKTTDTGKAGEAEVAAVASGTVKVRCTSSVSILQDSCAVTVIPAWTFEPYDYAEDMVVYATVKVDGQENAEQMEVAAFVGDELRGLGRLLTAGSKKYWAIRVYSNQRLDLGEDVEPEVVSFRCYQRGMGQLTTFKNTIKFDGAVHGTLTDLVKLEK